MDTDPSGSTQVSDSQALPVVMDEASGEPSYEHATNSIVVAFVVNFGIAILKFAAWFVSHSPAMFSEGLHSLGDAINSIALFIGIRLSRKDPDPSHPYGYSMQSNIWAIPACVFLLVFSGVAVYQGWVRLIEGEPEMTFLPGYEWVNPFWFSVIVLLISIVLEIYALHRASKAVLEDVGKPTEGLFIGLIALKEIKHVVGPTTRFIFYEESMALGGAVLALIAISLSEFSHSFGWLPEEYVHYPDAIASIIIGILLMVMSGYLFFHNSSILTGASAAPKVQQKIESLVEHIHGVTEVHELTTIDRGLAGVKVELKVEVEPETMVKDVDDLVEHIKDKVSSRISNVNREHISVEVFADETEEEWGARFTSIIEEGLAEEVLKPRDVALLRNVYDFTDITVEEIMVPRIDVVAIDITTPLPEAARLFVDEGHSRLPVYKENRDDVIGMVHIRDVFEVMVKDKVSSTQLESLVRDISIYPENKPVSDLLEDFKRNKLQIAVIVDEHGGFAGIVTIEDLMEEIVGEIWDEHDVEELELTILEPNRVRVSGKYDIDEINEKLSLNIPSDDFITVAGFVFGALGKEPKKGDIAQFEDLMLIVDGVDGHRITDILIASPIAFEITNDDDNDEQTHSNGSA